MAVESMVETGVSLVAQSGTWHAHKIALSLDEVEGRLASPALERWLELPLTRQVLVVRAIEEMLLCVFRRTVKDPNYASGEEESWRKVIDAQIGLEGTDRVGL